MGWDLPRRGSHVDYKHLTLLSSDARVEETRPLDAKREFLFFPSAVEYPSEAEAWLSKNGSRIVEENFDSVPIIHFY